MRKSLLLISVLVVGLFGFMSYCWLLIDCYQDLKQGRYEQQPLNSFLEVMIIVAYCYVAFRFLRSKLAGGQPPNL